MKKIRNGLLATLLLLGSVTAVIGSASAASAAVITQTGPAGATAIAAALAAPSVTVTGATFASTTGGTPNGTSDSSLTNFPTNGSTFGILTSGNVSSVDQPGTFASTSNGGDAVRGDTDQDVTILKADITVPTGANCLAFDFRFLSEEYPVYVGSSYNDAFIAELDTSDWTTSGSTISAPNNFAFDGAGDVVSINSTGLGGMSPAAGAGTAFDGITDTNGAATDLLSAFKQVTPGAHSIYFSVFDQGDTILDSAAFIDNLRAGFVPNPAVDCKSGAKPVSFQLALAPLTDSAPTGTSHTVSASLTDDAGQPVANAPIAFTISGANPQTGTGATNASGVATFTYVGTTAGTDQISGCYDADNAPPCEATGSASMTWTGVAVNHPPTVSAGPDVPTSPGTPVALNGSASDADGDALTLTWTVSDPACTVTPTNAAVASITCTTDGTYTATLTADDGHNPPVSDSATVTVTTAPPVNHPPTATAQTVTTPQDTAVAITLQGTDADGDALTFALGTGPAHGALSGTGANLTYTPNAGYNGPDSFTFTTNDGTVSSVPATVSISVTPPSTCAAPTLDVTRSRDMTTPTRRLSAPRISTTSQGELILAFIAVDGPTSPSQTITKVAGGKLTWTLAARSNTTWGTTEVWQAFAPKKLHNVRITAEMASKPWDGTITVAAFKGAASHVGAIGTGAGTSGSPTAELTTTGCTSQVWAVGHDWTHDATPVAGAGQSFVHTFLDTRVHDSYWVQRLDSPVAAGSHVVISDTGMSTDRWTLAAVEIPSA